MAVIIKIKTETKIIRYELGEQSINPTDKPYWKKKQKINANMV